MAPWKEFITTVSWSPTALVLSTPNNKFATIKIFKCLSTYSLNSWGVCIYFGKQLYITYSVFFQQPSEIDKAEETWAQRTDMAAQGGWQSDKRNHDLEIRSIDPTNALSSAPHLSSLCWSYSLPFQMCCLHVIGKWQGIIRGSSRFTASQFSCYKGKRSPFFQDVRKVSDKKSDGIVYHSR